LAPGGLRGEEPGLAQRWEHVLTKLADIFSIYVEVPARSKKPEWEDHHRSNLVTDDFGFTIIIVNNQLPPNRVDAEEVER
jgi:hypothetical protein